MSCSSTPPAAAGDGAGHYAGCAGVTPTEAYDASALVPLEPSITGGDAFDLADVGLGRARFVRIDDVGGMGEMPSGACRSTTGGCTRSKPSARSR